MMIYKLVGADEWRSAAAAGEWRGSAVDIADGYLHFSTATQAVETAARHFAGRRDLVLLAVDASRLGAALRWEPSRGGALFPHLYAALPTAAVVTAVALPPGVPVEQAVADAVRDG